MSKKIEIKKVVIQIGDQEASLTIEQARELKDALNELLGNKETVYLPSNPVIIERPYTYPRPYWGVTYGVTYGVTVGDTKTYNGTATYSLNQ